MEGYEIERRFLVRVERELWAELGAGNPLRQGYLHDGTPSVRIRTGEPRGAVLTVKKGTGVVRQEVETVVPHEVAEGLMEAAGRRVIEKVRFRIGPWELDRFGRGLSGLTLLEVELEEARDPIPTTPGGITIIREVTDDNTFTSGHLARMIENEQEEFVRRVYTEGRP